MQFQPRDSLDWGQDRDGSRQGRNWCELAQHRDPHTVTPPCPTMLEPSCSHESLQTTECLHQGDHGVQGGLGNRGDGTSAYWVLLGGWLHTKEHGTLLLSVNQKLVQKVFFGFVGWLYAWFVGNCFFCWAGGSGFYIEHTDFKP